MFFYVTILKFVNDFSKGAIYGKLSTFSSYQNHYQVNVYVYFLIIYTYIQENELGMILFENISEDSYKFQSILSVW